MGKCIGTIPKIGSYCFQNEITYLSFVIVLLIGLFLYK